VLEAGYVFCCPYGPFIRGTTAFGWGDCKSAEQRILESMRYLHEKYKIDNEGIVLFGFSEGGSMAFCTGFKNPEIFAGVISVAGYYDEELDQYLRDGSSKIAPTYMMIGENDFGVESNRKVAQLLKDRGTHVQLVIYEGMGHAFPPNGGEEVKKALKWLELAE
jgi:predicted esterase